MHRFIIIMAFTVSWAGMAAAAPSDAATSGSAVSDMAPVPPLEPNPPDMTAPQPADKTANAPGQQAKEQAAPRMSQQELDQIVGPIALYPDVLLSQVLAASTYPLDVIEADRWLKANNNDTSKIDEQSWDPSVKSVARFPQVIATMSENIPWLRQLGEAVMNQQPDVMDAVQRSRAKAQQTGALKSDQAQSVEESNNVIVIQPANPQVIYVPVYEPQAVYSSAYDYSYPYDYSYGGYYSSPIQYYPPVYSGGYLDMDCDWYGRSLYYGGWGFRHGFCNDDYFYRRHHRHFDHDYYGGDHRGRDFGRYANRWQHNSRNWAMYGRPGAVTRVGNNGTRNWDSGRMGRDLAGRYSRGGTGDRSRYRQDSNDVLGFVGPRPSGREALATARRSGGSTGFMGERMNRNLSSPPSERNFIAPQNTRFPTRSGNLIRSGNYGSNILQSRTYTRDRGTPEGVRQFGIRPNAPYRGFGTEWNMGGGGGVRTGTRGNPIASPRGPGGLRDSYLGSRGPVLGGTQGGGARGVYSAPSTGSRAGSAMSRGGTSIRGPNSLRGPVAGGGRNFGRSPNRR